MAHPKGAPPESAGTRIAKTSVGHSGALRQRSCAWCTALLHGTLSELSCSRFRKVLGHLTRPIIGGALIPFDVTDFPVDIRDYSKPDCPSIFKERI